jgi:hypothetical protein
MIRNHYATIRVEQDGTETVVWLTIWRQDGDRSVQVDSAPFWGDYDGCARWCEQIGYEVRTEDERE